MAEKKTPSAFSPHPLIVNLIRFMSSSSSSIAMAEKKTISIKLLVNRKTKKLVFAESGKEFVEILFSFLTLPISTIIRLAPKKKSDLGSIDSLYESVGSLENHFFETPGCKSMLINPKNSFLEGGYKSLAVDYYTSTLKNQYFVCPTWSCVSETHCLVSENSNLKCICGEKMTKKSCVVSKKADFDGLFIEGADRFIITDNLHVRKVSTETNVSVLREFGISDAGSLEEKIVSVGIKEVLNLLNRSLVSASPMSDVFLRKRKNIDNNSMEMNPQIPKTVSDLKMVSLILLVRKASEGDSIQKRREERVIYAIAKEDFLDFLVSILTFPVGAIMKVVGKSCHVGSLNSLYGGVGNLLKEDPEKFNKCKEKLLNPKIFRHYGVEKQLLKMEVSDALYTHTLLRCGACTKQNIAVADGKSCKHVLGNGKLRLINPKLIDTVCESGGGFIKKSTVFMVTDELKIEPHSPISCISYVNKLGVPLTELEERVVTISEHEALSILKASLTSRTVLTDVFCNNNKAETWA